MEKETKIPRVGDLRRVLLYEGTLSEHWAWRIKGTSVCHHPTEPSLRWKDGDWSWFWMNKEHRLDGPSSCWNGQYYYWIHGEPLTKEEWSNHPLRLEWLSNKLGGI